MKLSKIQRSNTKILLLSFVVVVVLSVVQLAGGSGVLSYALGWAVRPVTIPFEATSRVVRNTWNGFLSLKGLYVENAELKERVKQLEVDLAALASVEAENRVLRSNLGFGEEQKDQLSACTVLTRDPDGLTQTLLLSCGSDQGVKVGNAVVAQGYLVGKIVLTSAKTSTVRLLISPSVAVDAKVVGRDISGVVKGSFGSGMVLDLIPQTSGVTPGDLVTSAGINELIPPDVLIGTITEILRVPGGLFDQISLASPVDLRDLRFVYVIKH